MVDTRRRNPGSGAYIYPAHRLVTNYKYNSLQQLTEQSTPDGGISRFWYDAKGRLVVSQNAKQAGRATSPYNNTSRYLSSNKSYSYTLYDKLGRITQVGEIDHPVPMSYAISRHVYDAANPAANTINTDLSTWLDIGNTVSTIKKYEVVSTNYGTTNNIGNLLLGVQGQENLRNRVQGISYEAVNDNNATTSDYSSFYSYDIHGNVNRTAENHTFSSKMLL